MGNHLSKMQQVAPIIFIAAFLFSLLAQVSGSEDCLNIKIWSEKNTLLPLERLAIHFEITNRSPKTLYVADYNLTENLHVVDREGNVCFSGNYIVKCGLTCDSLAPKKSFIGYDYIQSSRKDTVPAVYSVSYIMPRHIFQAFPDVGCGGSFNFVSEPPQLPDCNLSVISNAIEVELLEPKGEDKEALRLFIKADSLPCPQHNESFTEADRELIYRQRQEWILQKFHAFIQVADMYPSTVYAPLALRHALFLPSMYENDSILIPLGKRIIENYPESAEYTMSFSRLMCIYKKTVGIEPAAEYLQFLIKTYPNSTISDKATYWLKRIEEGSIDC